MDACVAHARAPVQRARQRDVLGGRARGQRDERERHRRGGLIAQGIAREQAVEGRAGSCRIAHRERQARPFEAPALPCQRECVERPRRVAGEQQRASACNRDIARRRGRHVGEKHAHGGRVARDPRLAHAQPGIDRRQLPALAGRRERGGGAVGLSRRVERHSGTDCQQPGTRGGRAGACHLEMRRGFGIAAHAELRLAEQRQGLAVGVVEQPRLADQEGAGVLVTACVNFRLGAFDD